MRRACVMLTLLLALGLALSGCYAPDRSNPLDPSRTAPVALLRTTFDDERQTATLVWTRYQGIEPFQAYEIERRDPGADPTVIGQVGTVAETTYTDTTLLPGVAYTYRVGVRNRAGLAVASSARSGQVAAPIRVLGPVFDSRTGTAVLRWTRFRGREFRSYEVLRKTGQGVQALAVIQDVADTTFTDTGVEVSVVYTYQVVLTRTSGARLVLSAQPGGIHILLAQFGSFTIRHESYGDYTLAAIAVDRRGDVLYVLDTGTAQISKYDPNGNLVLSWVDPVLYGDPYASGLALAVDPVGGVWVATPDTASIFGVPAFVPTLKRYSPQGVLIGDYKGLYQFVSGFSGIAIDTNGDILGVGGPAGGGGFSRIYRIDPGGTVLGDLTGEVRVNGQVIDFFGGLSLFSDVVATSGSSDVLLFHLDTRLHASLAGRISVFDAYGLAFDASGQLFVVESPGGQGTPVSTRIQVFDQVVENHPRLVTQWPLPPSAAKARDVVVDSQGNVYVLTNGQVYKYGP